VHGLRAVSAVEVGRWAAAESMPAALDRKYLVAFVFVGRFSVLGFRLAADLVDLQRRKNYSAKEAVRVGRLTGEVFWLETACPKLLKELLSEGDCPGRQRLPVSLSFLPMLYGWSLGLILHFWRLRAKQR
jgi:hypothetical protein